MKKRTSVSLSLIALSLAFGTSGCLKTRAQLREESIEDGPRPAATGQVQDVQPQGSYVIDELKSEITRLTGRIEDLERARQEQHATAEKASASAVNKDELKKLEDRIAQLEQALVANQEAMKKMAAERPAVDPTDAFNAGKSQFEDGQFDQAIENFGIYLKSPKASKHLEEATFLRAEAYFSLKQYKKAIIDYSRFPEKFTKSRFMPAALYKIGLSFEGLGMKEDARSFFQELHDKYPKSPEAKKAKAKIK